MVGIEIANQLSDSGKDVFGWDFEWKMNFKNHKRDYGAETAYKKLIKKKTRLPAKNIILSHDDAFIERLDVLIIKYLLI